MPDPNYQPEDTDEEDVLNVTYDTSVQYDSRYGQQFSERNKVYVRPEAQFFSVPGIREHRYAFSARTTTQIEACRRMTIYATSVSKNLQRGKWTSIFIHASIHSMVHKTSCHYSLFRVPTHAESAPRTKHR